MADKVEKRAAAVLPLSVEKKKKKQQQQQQQQARVAPGLPAVRDVILWTLFNAGNVTFSFFAVGPAYVFIITTVFSNPPSWLVPRAVEMTDAQATVTDDLTDGMLWCAAPQAAAGVLALMLPSHRHRLRLFLAYAALVVTVAGHCMLAAVVRMFVAADPGDLFMKIVGTGGIFLFGVGDLLCFLGLILRGGAVE